LGVEVFVGELREAHFSAEEFDVVTLFHVLEHVLDPYSFLLEVNRILKENGLLVIRTPNIDSLISKVVGKYWSWVDPPRHLFYFSPDTLKKMLEKTGFGLINIQAQKGYSFNFWSELIHALSRMLFQKLGIISNNRPSDKKKARFMPFLIRSNVIMRLMHIRSIFEDMEIIAWARKGFKFSHDSEEKST
jgi:2-polyprenyl-3-methyl-5-hydroxy-6-metoxy-1,4-benzoquinol methylase